MDEEDKPELQGPHQRPGQRLRHAREAAGLDRAAIAERTKIPERLIQAIEDGNFAAMPARAYALGFSRTYARTLGLDQDEIVHDVTAELDAVDAERAVRRQPAFEPGDPARVPGVRLAWVGGAAAMALIVAGLFFMRSFFLPAAELPPITQETEEPAPPPKPTAPPSAPAPTSGPVVFTALQDGVWVKFYDGQGRQLMQKQMARGERYQLPPEVPDVKIWTGQPDMLSITVGGHVVPKLSEQRVTLKDVAVTASALLARPQPAAPTPAPTPQAPTPQTTAATSSTVQN